jgi:polyhydroxybutyrate depolymerase
MRTFTFLPVLVIGIWGCGGGDDVTIGRTTTSSSSSGAPAGGQGGAGGGGGGVGGNGGEGAGPSAACMGKSPMMAGDKDYSITTNAEKRDFRVHVPPGYDLQAPVALVIALHGYTEKIDEFMDISHFTDAVDKRGMIVAFPQGKAPLGVPGWNAGTCCGTAQIQNTPDVQFIRDMLAKIEEEYCLDPKRIFVSGFSNGGMLSHRLACEFSERVAAIGAVSGTMAIDPCIPKRAVPVLHIHGTSDIVVPYNNPVTAQTVPQTINGWVARNFCQAQSSVVYSKGSVKCELYGQCNADVQLCTIEGGSHEWPAGGSAMGVGDMPATEYILDFFQAHPMP